ncbi:MAG: CPBP family intramembrane metalloprotease, partial [Pseudobdellovibrionaceae bacterium]|nr:CPBP family intramembrane metalloprotease [Pseudobdellovibrionaceae bacterium]
MNIMKKQYGATALAYLAFLVPYTLGWSWNWWKFPAASLAIVLLMKLGDTRHYAQRLGLNFKPFLMVAAFAVFWIAGLCFDKFAVPTLQQHGYEPSRAEDSLLWKLSLLCQAWNEEMLLRAFLLSSLARVMPGFVEGLFLAAVFAIGHLIYYAAVSPGSHFSGSAVLTLFFFFVGSNAAFYATRSLLVPFAVHAGWNIKKFGEEWRNTATGEPLEEGASFGMVEGSFPVLVVALLFALIAHVLSVVPRGPA